MKRVPVTIEGVDYLFIPSKCKIYPVVSTDVIVERWVQECFEPDPLDMVSQAEYYPIYRAWGGNLNRINLTKALLRLGYDAKRRIMHEGKSRLLWSGVRLKSEHKTTTTK